MSTIKERLIEHEKKEGIFRIGLVGAGQMGTGLISQIEKMHGLAVVAVADILPTRAMDAYKDASVDTDVIHWVEDDLDKAGSLIKDSQRITTHSSEFLVNIPGLDAIVESTGIPNVGALTCSQAIDAGKAIISMNVETDATIGYYLTQKAQDKGNHPPGCGQRLSDPICRRRQCRYLRRTSGEPLCASDRGKSRTFHPPGR